MPDRDARDAKPEGAPPAPAVARTAAPASDKFLCDRCGAEMFRMHAVWRCPACGYKTDCCGW
jgi:rubrerythrin